jgi:hypothetical protein
VPDPFTRKIAVAHARITPLSCNDLALVATDTPPILLSTRVKYIECKSPSNRVVFVRKHGMAHALRQTTMEQYEARPMAIYGDIDIRKLNMQQYHCHFAVFSKPALLKAFGMRFDQLKYRRLCALPCNSVAPSHVCPLMKYATFFVGLDAWRNLIFKRSQKELVRFSVADPGNDLEEWCFTLLCRDIAFTNERDLLFHGSYVLSCVYKHKILNTDDKVETELASFYAYRYKSAFLTDGTKQSILERLRGFTVTPRSSCFGHIGKTDMDRATEIAREVDMTMSNHSHVLDKSQQDVLDRVVRDEVVYLLYQADQVQAKHFLQSI